MEKRGHTVTCRVDARLFLKVKTAAAGKNMRVGEYIRSVLADSTEGILLSEEDERTLAFLDECAGAWSGPETTEEIMQYIRDGRTPRKEIEL